MQIEFFTLEKQPHGMFHKSQTRIRKFEVTTALHIPQKLYFSKFKVSFEQSCIVCSLQHEISKIETFTQKVRYSQNIQEIVMHTRSLVKNIQNAKILSTQTKFT